MTNHDPTKRKHPQLNTDADIGNGYINSSNLSPGHVCRNVCKDAGIALLGIVDNMRLF